ncbi:hypothetical protein B7494_g3289 [Chlorociboria aeruginascens]|nr:hypothetical protein B7494_g3289 [Chlorociboria aeruginascens]
MDGSRDADYHWSDDPIWNNTSDLQAIKHYHENIARRWKLTTMPLTMSDYDHIISLNPTISIQFPLSLDYRLFTLVQYNTLHAIFDLIGILLIWDNTLRVQGEALSIPSLSINLPPNLPPNLQLTSLQRSVPHEPWIRILPFPAMRNNLTIHAEKYNVNDLCRDLCWGLYDSYSDVERCGLVVWNKGDVQCWEVSEGFERKWGFLLDGCADLIESTNQ